MRYLNHDTGTVTILSDFSATVSHVLQHMQCLVHQPVTLVTMNVHNHAHAAGIVLILVLIKSSFLVLKFTFCHIILIKSMFLYLFECKDRAKRQN